MRRSLLFLTKDIKDQATQQAFETLRRFFKGHPTAGSDWQHLEVSYGAAVTKAKLAHTIGATPKDIIQTFKTGAGDVTFEYDDFDRNFVVITTTGPAKIRFLVGSYRG